MLYFSTSEDVPWPSGSFSSPLFPSSALTGLSSYKTLFSLDWVGPSYGASNGMRRFPYWLGRLAGYHGRGQIRNSKRWCLCFVNNIKNVSTWCLYVCVCAYIYERFIPSFQFNWLDHVQKFLSLDFFPRNSDNGVEMRHPFSKAAFQAPHISRLHLIAQESATLDYAKTRKLHGLYRPPV